MELIREPGLYCRWLVGFRISLELWSPPSLQGLLLDGAIGASCGGVREIAAVVVEIRKASLTPEFSADQQNNSAEILTTKLGSTPEFGGTISVRYVAGEKKLLPCTTCYSSTQAWTCKRETRVTPIEPSLAHVISARQSPGNLSKTSTQRPIISSAPGRSPMAAFSKARNLLGHWSVDLS